MKDWTLQWPAFLLLFGLLPSLAYLIIRAHKQRKHALNLLGQPGSSYQTNAHWIRTCALACLIFALARPGYNPQPLFQQDSGRDVVIALDVSRSMLAADLQPNRLEVAKQGIRDSLKSLTNSRVGLIVYGGSASILCPLTRDHNFIRYMLEHAGSHSVDFGGTQLLAAIEKAIDQVFDASNLTNSDLIILSDGGNPASTEHRIAELIDSSGIHAYIVGLGDPQQASAIEIKDANDQIILIKYKDQIVRTKLEDAALKSLAAKSTGIQYHAIGTSPFDLGRLYSQQVEPSHNSPNSTTTNRYRYQELAPYLIGFSGLLLFLSYKPLSKECTRISGVWLLLMVLIPLCGKLSAAAGASENQAAIARMQLGDLETAATQFEALYLDLEARHAPTSHLAIIQYNLGLTWSQQALHLESLEAQLALTTRAQTAFLRAKRWQPRLQQASGQIDQIADRIRSIEQALTTQSLAEQQQTNQTMELLNLLKTLLATQISIREQFSELPSQAAKLVLQQQAAIQNTRDIKTTLKNLQSIIQSSNPPNKSELDILIEAHSELSRCQMQQATLAQFIPNYPQSPNVCIELTTAIEARIQRVIELFSDPAMESDAFDMKWSELDEDYTQSESDENSQSSSSNYAGDFAQSSVMQALPIPNYSSETILQEEEGSQQFRQQQRKAGKAATVEKDY
jgi:Mg-chelatase subunit ChlD